MNIVKGGRSTKGSTKDLVMQAMDRTQQSAAAVSGTLGLPMISVQRALWALHKDGRVTKQGGTRDATWTRTLPMMKILLDEPENTPMRMVGIMRGCARAFIRMDDEMFYVTPGVGLISVEPEMAVQMSREVLEREGFEWVDETFDTEEELRECLLADWKMVNTDGCRKYVMDDPLAPITDLEPWAFKLMVDAISGDFASNKHTEVVRVGYGMLSRNVALEDTPDYVALEGLVKLSREHETVQA